ncbi:hypothetical protein HYW58_02735 [Candidatus Kaiserbacteria bacterium]|nr:hypothetical protein [Candidatus Kaiserbacteria bacterium]
MDKKTSGELMGRAPHNAGRDSKSASADILMVAPFGENHACAHAYKKTEKLLIAVHLITNFVPESEPIRHAIRDISIHILSDILKLRFGLRSAGPEKVNDTIASVCNIISLLNVLHASGFISDMNLEVLQREFTNYAGFLRAIEDTDEAQSMKLSESYFAVPSDKRHLRGKGSMSFSTQSSTKRHTGHSLKRTPSSQTHLQRRDKILAIIKDKKRVTVKDISSVVSDCSEKTIQRELIVMMHEGVLKKEGERRWSAYSLV